jgi:hypothetical protein
MVNLATDENAFPVYSGGMTGGYLQGMFLSREEYLIHIVAHEIRHFWQKKHSRINRKMWRVWHNKRKSSYMETDADAFAIRIQREWRKLKIPREAYRMVKEE